MAHRLLDTPEKTGSAHPGVAHYSGSLLNSLETAVTKVTEQNKPRCENEQVWNGVDFSHGQNATPCNAPNAEFYKWNEGGLEHEAFLCGSCADSLGVF